MSVTAQGKLDRNGRVAIPAMMIPGFRTSIAVQDGVEKNLLFRTWGGLGDQICAEPTLRYALKTFKGCSISLSSEHPELFQHLKFDNVWDEKIEKPDFKKFLVLDTITPPDDTNLVWQFFSHMLTNCVDFPSLCALRSQLPVKDREIFLTGKCPENLSMNLDRSIFIHPGRHWPSKTFPKKWWDTVTFELIRCGYQPTLIGADTDDNRGTVDVETRGCQDLRNKLSVAETTWLLQRARVLITNDSAPLHMAASTDPENSFTGYCAIKFIATCKHPDFISHFRKGRWQFNEQNLGLGGMWDLMSNCPNQDEKITVDQVPEETLAAWLPTPFDVVKSVSAVF